MANRINIRALVFDAYGTLFDLTTVAEACELRFPGNGRELNQLWRRKQLAYTWLLTLTGGYLDFWDLSRRALGSASRSLGLECDAAAQQWLLSSQVELEPFPDVRGALEPLSGLRLAILSNGTPDMLRPLVERAGLGDFFDHVLSAHEVSAYKPAPQVYDLAARRLGLRPENIGLVAAHHWDILGAQSYGFWTCFIERDGPLNDELGAPPDMTVRRLTELADALEP